MWRAEVQKYGPVTKTLNRASDGDSTDLDETPAVRERILKAKKKFKNSLYLQKEALIDHRETAMVRAKAKLGKQFSKQTFNIMYPPYKFEDSEVTFF